jgi:hypothetical protein
MAGISHTSRRAKASLLTVLLVVSLAIVTVAALALTSRDSGGSPSTPTPAVHIVASRAGETCTWHPNGWYC